MKPLHTADMLGHPVRFFRSPLPGEDLPWHVTDDLFKACGMGRAMRRDTEAKLRRKWGGNVRSIISHGKSLTIAPHWMAQGMVGAVDEVAAGKPCSDDVDITGQHWTAYCLAVHAANEVLLREAGLPDREAYERTARAAQRVEGGEHVH